jgi:hypothetical protein
MATPDPRVVEDFEIADAMEKYGGTFVKALGQLWHLADPENARKLKGAFPEYWEKYADIARTRQRPDRVG